MQFPSVPVGGIVPNSLNSESWLVDDSLQPTISLNRATSLTPQQQTGSHSMTLQSPVGSMLSNDPLFSRSPDPAVGSFGMSDTNEWTADADPSTDIAPSDVDMQYGSIPLEQTSSSLLFGSAAAFHSSPPQPQLLQSLPSNSNFALRTGARVMPSAAAMKVSEEWVRVDGFTGQIIPASEIAFQPLTVNHHAAARGDLIAMQQAAIAQHAAVKAAFNNSASASSSSSRPPAAAAAAASGPISYDAFTGSPL